METAAEFIFWGALAALTYTYIGYPAVLWCWTRRVRRAVAKAPFFPTVSVVIAAHNEESRIAQRIDNCLAVDYPADRLEVVVVCDGCDDGTADVVRRSATERVRLVSLPERLGKAEALNRGVAESRGEIVVFTDARQVFDPSAVRELSANFHDPQVGAVSGELVLLEGPERAPRPATGLYWRYETWIRKSESLAGSVVGVSGSIYAIRRHLFTPLPAGTILDDVLVPMRVIFQGYRVVFEERAKAFDYASSRFEQEFRRKVRTLAGNYQLLRLSPDLLRPRRNRLLFQYVSHKVSRLVAPFCLLGLLGTSATLAGGVYATALSVQAIGYGLACAGWRLRRQNIRMPVVSVPATFVMLNYAALLGLILFLQGRCDKPDLWVKT